MRLNRAQPFAACLVWSLLLSLHAPGSEPSIQDGLSAAREGRHAEAAAIFEKLAAANPFDARPQRNLGFALGELKQYDRAVEAFERAIEVGDAPAANAFNQACMLCRAGKLDEAAAALERALGLRFENDELLRTDPDLAPLRADPRFAYIFGRKLPEGASAGERWAADIEYLKFRMPRLHWDLYRQTTPQALDAGFAALQQAAATQSDAQTANGLRKLLATIGDGHTLLGRGSVPPLARLPLELYVYTDGVYVRGVRSDLPEHRALLGWRVLGVGPLSIDAALEAVKPYCSVDNPMGYLDWAPFMLTHPHVLAAIGASADGSAVDYRLQGPSGAETVTLTPVAAPPGSHSAPFERLGEQPGQTPPLYRRNPDHTLWFEHLPDAQAVYFCMRAVDDAADKSLADFAAELFAFIAEHEVRHLVLDLRENGGGNSGVIPPLLHGLIRCAEIQRPDGLFVITGRRTFSAAMNLTTLLEFHLQPVFVGEPTGSSPNFVGESTSIRLPNSGYDVYCSARYWQFVVSTDRRIWIAPHVVAQPSSGDAAAGRDPALDAILARIQPTPSAETRP